MISAIRIGQSGDAFVLDGSGRLVAHPDDATVAAEAGEAATLKPLGSHPLRGFAEAVPVFSVKKRDSDLASRHPPR